MEFEIEIKETLSRVEKIEAETLEEAKEIAREMYRNGEIELTSDNYIDTDFLEYEDEIPCRRMIR